MARKSKFTYNHRQNIESYQPAILKALYPGMIVQFTYVGDNIFDKNTLILLLYREGVGHGNSYDLVHGLNLNYLPESLVQRLFCSCENLHKGASVYSNQPISRVIQNHMSAFDDTKPYRNLLREDFTRIKLPTYKEKRDGNPLSLSEAQRQMKMLYEKVIRKVIAKHHIYRTYTQSKMKTIKVVKYRLGEWSQPGVEET